MGEKLIYLDDDIEINKNYLEVLDSILIDASVSFVEGKVLPFNVVLPSWLPERYFYLVSIFSLSEDAQMIKYLIGEIFVVCKTIVDKVGGFDVRLGRNDYKLVGGEQINFLNRRI